MLYLWGRTGRGGGELVGGELVMGRNLRNSYANLLSFHSVELSNFRFSISSSQQVTSIFAGFLSVSELFCAIFSAHFTRWTGN